MSRQVKIILIALLSLLLVGGVAFGTVKYVGYKQAETAMEEKTRQIEFLKAHETEMTEYVKKQNPKITSVQYDWNSVETGVIGNGLPQGAGNVLTMRITIFDKDAKEINAFGFAVRPNNIQQPTSIEAMYTINASYDYFKEVS
ncbi:MAG: hypothetical protein SOI66_07125 [Bifidobacterium sp.]|jgi:PBP1b-binding outer membrane lipoprotein LpoB